MLAFAVSILATESAPGGGGGGGFGTLPLLLVMGVVFWLLIIRPQQRRAKEQRSLLSSLGPGDRVVSIGGIHGTIVEIDDDTVRLEIAPGTVVTFARQAVGRRLVDADEGDDDESTATVDDVAGTSDHGAATGGSTVHGNGHPDQP